jgi:hypothetical protein
MGELVWGSTHNSMLARSRQQQQQDSRGSSSSHRWTKAGAISSSSGSGGHEETAAATIAAGEICSQFVWQVRDGGVGDARMDCVLDGRQVLVSVDVDALCAASLYVVAGIMHGNHSVGDMHQFRALMYGRSIVHVSSAHSTCQHHAAGLLLQCQHSIEGGMYSYTRLLDAGRYTGGLPCHGW